MKPKHWFIQFLGQVGKMFGRLSTETSRWDGAYCYKAYCKNCDWSINTEVPIYSESQFLKLARQHDRKMNHNVGFDNRRTPGRRLMPKIADTPCNGCGKHRDYGDVLLAKHCSVCDEVEF